MCERSAEVTVLIPAGHEVEGAGPALHTLVPGGGKPVHRHLCPVPDPSVVGGGDQ